MKNRISASVLSSALAFASITSVNPALAQADARPAPQKSVKPGKPDIVIKCCQCVGGKNEAANISTGTASWTVSSKPTAPPQQPPGGYSAINSSLIQAMPTNMSPQVPAGNIGANPLPGTWATIPGASWVQPGPGTSATSFQNGHWTYALKVHVPNCTVPQKVTISGQLAADDMARMYVDHGLGTSQTLVGNPPAHFAANGSTTRSFSAVLNPSLPGGFTRPGIYTIRVEMDNLGGSVSGIVLQGALASTCSESMTRIRPRDKNEAEAENTAAECLDC